VLLQKKEMVGNGLLAITPDENKTKKSYHVKSENQKRKKVSFRFFAWAGSGGGFFAPDRFREKFSQCRSE
jgi:hypothetical protein